jgi:RNA polymerase sigma-70 factor (ECF subfamily)
MASAADGFHTLVDAHYEALFRYAYRLAGTASDAEDLTQEAFGKAFTRLSQLREHDRAKAWLYRILRNLYLHKVRDEKRHRIIPLDSVGDLPNRDASETPEIEPEKLQEALNELEEGFRTPLILFYFEEFSYRDIAEQMDLPIGTVMSRLARAKTYLRVKLTPRGERGECVEQDLAGSDGKVEAKVEKVEKGQKEVSDAVP